MSVFDCIARNQNCFFVRVSANQRSRKRTKKQFRSRGIQSSAGQNSDPPYMYVNREHRLFYAGVLVVSNKICRLENENKCRRGSVESTSNF